jgi:hypothetical protein
MCCVLYYTLYCLHVRVLSTTVFSVLFARSVYSVYSVLWCATPYCVQVQFTGYRTVCAFGGQAYSVLCTFSVQCILCTLCTFSVQCILCHVHVQVYGHLSTVALLQGAASQVTAPTTAALVVEPLKKLGGWFDKLLLYGRLFVLFLLCFLFLLLYFWLSFSSLCEISFVLFRFICPFCSICYFVRSFFPLSRVHLILNLGSLCICHVLLQRFAIVLSLVHVCTHTHLHTQTLPKAM